MSFTAKKFYLFSADGRVGNIGSFGSIGSVGSFGSIGSDGNTGRGRSGCMGVFTVVPGAVAMGVAVGAVTTSGAAAEGGAEINGPVDGSTGTV